MPMNDPSTLVGGATSTAPSTAPASTGGMNNPSTLVGAKPSQTQTTPPPSSAPASNIPLFSLTGQDKAGEFVQSLADSYTGGIGPWMVGKIGGAFGGPDVEAVRRQVQQGREDIGPLASGVADVAGYALGPGELKIGEKLAA